MQQLLIVDDEPNIVEGLVNQIENWNNESIIIFKAYSGMQALEILENNKIDVVLSDIKMAGMGGLQLIKKVESLWPRCRFVFLTGYNDFEYIHKASKSSIYAGYLLKTEGIEVILEKVNEELKKSNAAAQKEKTLQNLKQEIRKFQPVLHNVVIEGMIKGHGTAFANDNQVDDMINLNIDKTKDIYIVIGKIMNKDDNIHNLKCLMITGQILSDEVRNLLKNESIIYDNSILCWLFQPIPGNKLFKESKKNCNSLLRYLHAVMLSLQHQLNDYYGYPVTFVLSSQAVNINKSYIQVELLKSILHMLNLDGQNLMIIDQNANSEIMLSGKKLPAIENILFSEQIKQLESILEDGIASDFISAFDKLFKKNGHYVVPKTDEIVLLVMMALSVIKRNNLSEDNLFADKVFIPSNDEDKETFLSQFLNLCCKICDKRIENEGTSREGIINKINIYINDNIENFDLSLSHIANVTGFNPSYLSRFYKLNTGIKLSDYISLKKFEHSKKLLKSGMHICDVASKIGYESPSSFILFFKRKQGITPKQYQTEHNCPVLN